MRSKEEKRTLPEADSEPYHTSKMELLAKNFNGFRPLTFLTKPSI